MENVTQNPQKKNQDIRYPGQSNQNGPNLQGKHKNDDRAPKPQQKTDAAKNGPKGEGSRREREEENRPRAGA